MKTKAATLIAAHLPASFFHIHYFMHQVGARGGERQWEHTGKATVLVHLYMDSDEAGALCDALAELMKEANRERSTNRAQ